LTEWPERSPRYARDGRSNIMQVKNKRFFFMKNSRWIPPSLLGGGKRARRRREPGWNFEQSIV